MAGMGRAELLSTFAPDLELVPASGKAGDGLGVESKRVVQI